MGTQCSELLLLTHVLAILMISADLTNACGRCFLPFFYDFLKLIVEVVVHLG